MCKGKIQPFRPAGIYGLMSDIIAITPLYSIFDNLNVSYFLSLYTVVSQVMMQVDFGWIPTNFHSFLWCIQKDYNKSHFTETEIIFPFYFVVTEPKNV
jgi:hypothetical protein